MPLLPLERVTEVRAGDFTGDGLADVLVNGQQQPYDSINGTFRAVTMASCGAGCLAPEEVIEGWLPRLTGDFNGDGADDAVMFDRQFYTGNVRLYFGGPAAGDRQAGLSSDDWIALPPAFLYQSGDFDGDGDLDLLNATVEMTYYLRYDVLHNDGDAGFIFHATVGNSWISGPGPFALIVHDGTKDQILIHDFQSYPGLPGRSVYAVGDIDGDGRDDLARAGDGQVRFLRGTASGFTPFPDFQTITYPAGAPTMTLEDLDGDGLVDFAMFAPDGGSTYLSGTGDGGFPFAHVGTLPTSVAVFGDVDGDDKPDAIAASPDRLGIQVHPNTATP